MNTNSLVHIFGRDIGICCLYKTGREKVFEDGYSGPERAAYRERDNIIQVESDILEVNFGYPIHLRYLR